MTISLQTIVDKWDDIAQEATLAAQLNITLSALRDAIVDVGGDATTTKDLLDKLEAVRALLAGVQTVTGSVSVSASALPAGAATQATLADVKTATEAIVAWAATVDVDDRVAREVGLVTTKSPAALSHAISSVITAGTRVQLTAAACAQLIITASASNTGNIYIGDVTVDNASHGVYLAAGEQVTIPVSNANLIYIDSDVNGDGIVYLIT